MKGFSKKDVVEKMELEKTVEQSGVIQRLSHVETKVKELETEVHELQLAKKRLHPDD